MKIDDCEISKVRSDYMMGPLTRWEYKSCRADFGEGQEWATLYFIKSDEPGKGHATILLTSAKRYYEGLGKRFGGTVALNDRMQRIYQRLGIHEYTGMEEAGKPRRVL